MEGHSVHEDDFTSMSRTVAILILILAAALEAGGDAIIRAGLHTSTMMHRVLLFALAAIVLFAYGWTINVPPWDFGKLLGLYVVFFFLFAQLISWLVFKQTPSLMVLAGGVLILIGGVVIALDTMSA
jgi:drug/metabolite transporter (DMT)-like permease